jgi:hypothetical protein
VPSELSLANIIQTMGLADISFLVVGLLAAKLAERQLYTDVQLAEATRRSPICAPCTSASSNRSGRD